MTIPSLPGGPVLWQSSQSSPRAARIDSLRTIMAASPEGFPSRWKVRPRFWNGKSEKI